MTAEDRQVVRKRCVRGFLVRPDDLAKFHDWNWCKAHVRVERPWHWFRVDALRRISRLYAYQRRMDAGPGNPGAMLLVDDQAGHRRIVPLSLGLIGQETPVCAPCVIDWDARLKMSGMSDLVLESGPWVGG